MFPEDFSLARLRRSHVLRAAVVALSAALASIGCGERPPGPSARPSASEGLVYLLPTSGGGADIAMIRLSDGAVERLTDTPDEIETDPLWVSSMQQVVYLLWPKVERPKVQRKPGEASASSRLMLIDPRTGETASATESIGIRQSEPSVSPDGKQIAYVFRSASKRGVRVVRPMTLRAETFSGAPRGASFRRPRVSPDGDSLVVEVRRANRRHDLWRLLPQLQHEVITQDPKFVDSRPRFSRGGDEVYFQRSVIETMRQRRRRAGSGRPPLGGGDVCAIQLATTQIRCIAASEDAREYAVEASPTRDEVVFLREGSDGTDLFLSDAEGKEVRALTESPSVKERAPRWSPDGELVAFESRRQDERVITVIDREGRVIRETPGFSPEWAAPLSSFAPAAGASRPAAGAL